MATIILIIDRSIVAYGKPGEINLSLLGRFLLAVAAGFLVAELFLIKVFEDSITEQQVLEVRTQKENIKNSMRKNSKSYIKL